MSRNIIAGIILISVILINFSFKTQITQSGNYQNHGNNNYRIYEKQSYLILDTAAFYLYYRYESDEKVKGKGLVKVGKYFFSKDAGSPILVLTTDNLEKTFPDNISFHYAVESHFRTDQELIGYDTYCNCYKLKYIYKQSLK